MGVARPEDEDNIAAIAATITVLTIFFITATFSLWS
jgi:hypothetical protein